MEGKIWKAKEKNILGVKVEIFSSCGRIENAKKETVKIPYEIYSLWQLLLLKYEKLEWGGVFNVVDGEVRDFRIPKQEVGWASVGFKEELGGNGVIHSHNTMGNFFSTTDHDTCINLFDYGFVISNDGKIQGVHKVATACGGYVYTKIDIEISINQDLPIIKEIEEKITERTYTYKGGYYYDFGDATQGLGWERWRWQKNKKEQAEKAEKNTPALLDWKENKKELWKKKNKKGKGKAYDCDNCNRKSCMNCPMWNRAEREQILIERKEAKLPDMSVYKLNIENFVKENCKECKDQECQTCPLYNEMFGDMEIIE